MFTGSICCPELCDISWFLTGGIVVFSQAPLFGEMVPQRSLYSVMHADPVGEQRELLQIIPLYMPDLIQMNMRTIE